MIELWRDGELVARYTPTTACITNGKLYITMPPGYIELVTQDELRFYPTEVIAWIKKQLESQT
jgi:hypothetical protein